MSSYTANALTRIVLILFLWVNDGQGILSMSSHHPLFLQTNHVLRMVCETLCDDLQCYMRHNPTFKLSTVEDTANDYDSYLRVKPYFRIDLDIDREQGSLILMVNFV